MSDRYQCDVWNQIIGPSAGVMSAGEAVAALNTLQSMVDRRDARIAELEERLRGAAMTLKTALDAWHADDSQPFSPDELLDAMGEVASLVEVSDTDWRCAMSDLLRSMVGSCLSLAGIMFAVGGWLHWDNSWITLLGGGLFGIGYLMAWRGERAMGRYIGQTYQQVRSRLVREAELEARIAELTAANPFGIEAIRARAFDTLTPGEACVWGVDLAKSTDWTVAIALDITGRVVGFQRWQAPWKNELEAAAVRETSLSVRVKELEDGLREIDDADPWNYAMPVMKRLGLKGKQLKRLRDRLEREYESAEAEDRDDRLLWYDDFRAVADAIDRIAELEKKQHEEGRATVYLSRRNLLTLLNKLDRKKGGEWSACGLVKSDTVHAQYQCSHLVYVYAVEDEDYYDDREAGPVHPQ